MRLSRVESLASSISYISSSSFGADRQRELAARKSMSSSILLFSNNQNFEMKDEVKENVKNRKYYFRPEDNQIMSFQFSQNLLADLQSQSPNSSQSLAATQQILPASQNNSQPLLSQSQSNLQLQSQNLLENNQSQDYFPPPQNIRPRPKFPRSKSSQSLLSHQQQPPSMVGSRVPHSRFNQGPSPLNISLANSLKQVQRRLDEFPVQVAKMLEEGFDHLQTEAKKHSSQSQESSTEVCKVLEKIHAATKDKDVRVKKILEDCFNELKDCAEEIQSHKLVRDKYEEVIQVMKEIINKQAAEIEQLKKESKKEKTIQGTLRVKSDDELLNRHPLIKKQKPSLLSPSISRLPRAFFIRPQFTIPSQSSSSSSEPRSANPMDLLMEDSDSDDEEVQMEDNSPGLGVDFSELIALSDSEEEEEVMIVEE